MAKALDELIRELSDLSPEAWECHDNSVWRLRLDSGNTVELRNVSQHDKLEMCLGDSQIPLARDQQMMLFRMYLAHRSIQQERMLVFAVAQVRQLKQMRMLSVSVDAPNDTRKG
jgi:hypothetical protein